MLRLTMMDDSQKMIAADWIKMSKEGVGYFNKELMCMQIVTYDKIKKIDFTTEITEEMKIKSTKLQILASDNREVKIKEHNVKMPQHTGKSPAEKGSSHGPASRRKLSSSANKSVARKISKLIREGKPPKQAQGQAFGMQRAGKL